MSKEKLFLISAVFSVWLCLLYVSMLTVHLTNSNDYVGLESYIYWGIIQLSFTGVSLYQYKYSNYYRSTSLNLFLLYLVPFILYSLFTLFELGKTNMHSGLFLIYLISYLITTSIYLISIFMKT